MFEPIDAYKGDFARAQFYMITAYEDKVGRRAIRVNDLADLSTLGPKIDRMLAHHNAQILATDRNALLGQFFNLGN